MMQLCVIRARELLNLRGRFDGNRERVRRSRLGLALSTSPESPQRKEFPRMLSNLMRTGLAAAFLLIAGLMSNAQQTRPAQPVKVPPVEDKAAPTVTYRAK